MNKSAVEVLAGVLSDHEAGKLSSAGVVQTLRTQIARLREPAEAQVPSYDALLIIAQSVCGALERAGITDCDDPGEAIDVLRERYEAQAQGGGEVVCDCPGEGRRDPVLHAPNCPVRTAPPSAPVGVDGCTESNCPRCLTHPDHRGDMAHAGIGSYPAQQPPTAPVGVEGLAGKIGVRYAQHESCKPGVPFYAFTADELRRFAAALAAQPGGSDNDR